VPPQPDDLPEPTNSGSASPGAGRLLEAAKRVLAIDAAHGLPDENMSFDAFNEWVAALFALKEAVERAESDV